MLDAILTETNYESVYFIHSVSLISFIQGVEVNGKFSSISLVNVLEEAKTYRQIHGGTLSQLHWIKYDRLTNEVKAEPITSTQVAP